jgi:PBSX family phage terminase large subunit
MAKSSSWTKGKAPVPTLELHPKQGLAFESDKKITACSAGIQSGKTTVAALWFRKQLSLWSKSNLPGPHNFLIGAPTYKILNQSTLPAFLKIMQGRGEYKKGDQEYLLPNDCKVFFRTSQDPDSVEGITNVRAGWMDEAGKCKYLFWVNFEGRCARTNAPIFLSTTPYARNWVFTEVIRPFQRNERDDIAYFNWRSIDNPTFSREFYDRQKQILDPVRFAMKYDGDHARRHGLVFPLSDGHIVPPRTLESSVTYYGGIDWGFSDPLVFVIRGVTPQGQDVQVKEFYQSGIFPDDIPKIALQLQNTYNVKLFLADPSDPGKIGMLQKYGVRVVGADNDIRAGIDAHNKAIRTNKYQVFNTCKHTLDEYETYHWPDEEDDEGVDAEDKPVDSSNHAMDANRYVSLYLDRMGTYDNLNLKVIDSENRKSQILELTHVPAWQRRKGYEKKYDEL